jgi:hypothetical protein
VEIKLISPDKRQKSSCKAKGKMTDFNLDENNYLSNDDNYSFSSNASDLRAGLNFNPGQLAALDGLGEDLHVPGIYGLIGGAGRGKTFTFQHLIKEFCASKPEAARIVVTAPTNKAVGVARKMGEQAGIAQNIEYRTVHSLLGLSVDEQEGEKQLKKSSRERNIHENDLIVIDEGSMVSKDLVEKVLCEIEGRLPILVVMDKYQLPPVGEPIPSLQLKVEKSYELIQNMRQGIDSPCSIIAEDCMNAVIEGRYSYDPRRDESLIKRNGKTAGTWLMSVPDWNRYIIPAFKAANKAGNWDNARVLAFFHRTIEDVNEYIRENLFGEIFSTQAYIPGEPLVCLSPVTRMVWNDYKQKMIKSIILPTASEMKVYSARESIDSIQIADKTYTYPVWDVCATIDENTYWLKVPSPQIKKQWKENCNMLKAIAVKAAKEGSKGYWRYYYQLLDFFDDVRVAYGMTIYSCQGSTYKNIFMPGNDIAGIKNFDIRNRSWYVGITRASEKIILC